MSLLLSSLRQMGEKKPFKQGRALTPSQSAGRSTKASEELKSRHDEYLRRWSIESGTAIDRIEELNRRRSPGHGARRLSNFAAMKNAGPISKAGNSNEVLERRRASLDKLRRRSGVQSRLEERKQEERRMSGSLRVRWE